jgi:hypothetical protein
MRQLALLLWLFLATASVAAETTMSIKGFKLGMKKADAISIYPALERKTFAASPDFERCRYVVGANPQRRIIELDTIAEQPAELWVLNFVDGKLGQVIVQFPAVFYQEVRAALISKFGNRDDERRELFKLSSRHTIGGMRTSWQRFGWKETLMADEYVSERLSGIDLKSSSYRDREQAEAWKHSGRRAKDL